MPGPDHTRTRERCVVMRTSQYALFSLKTAGSQWPMANKNGIFDRVLSAVRVCGEGRSPCLPHICLSPRSVHDLSFLMVLQLDSNQYWALFFSLFSMFYTGVLTILSGEKHREVGSPGRCAFFVMSHYIVDHHSSNQPSMLTIRVLVVFL